ncbi:hypothetical protein OLX02_10535 [Novosphingobium sp. KCTC 2891]|uniref:hypothetical protein n=1 Tax=Novosphingobium sp. KCTC 2891 TaxID=2989730 RepID=UPI002221D2B3|nr:hypothetical protein [Novosphingobium sp. KCTC 2891]MCW1383259.1 hypothetical protein [Novosphingobium sp. KCTC 2891]
MTEILGMALVAAVVAAAAIDIALRRAGVGDFPLFARDPRSVYRMGSSQKGRFRNRYGWSYNRLGMRMEADIGSLAGGTILLGDSIVDGGFKLDQSQTLAVQVAASTGECVYPVASHGWALTNELEALAQMPDWQKARRLVWLANSGDFDTIGEGENELSFPTRNPLWLTLWLVRRQLYRKNPRWWPGYRPKPEKRRKPELRAATLARFKTMADQFEGMIVIVRYPMRNEDTSAEPFWQQLAEIRPGIHLIDLGECPQWGAHCYGDFIHPNAHGVTVLSAFLAQAISARPA